MTALTAIQHLANMHRAAVMSAVHADQPTADTYRDLALELHEAMDSITHGVQPEEVINDLGALWSATAGECGSPDVEMLYVAWAAMLSTVEEGT